MLNADYKIKRHDIKFLESNEFHYSSRFSGEDETVYIKQFPMYKYNDRTRFDGRFLVLVDTGEVRVDVIDNSDGSLYGPWYYENNQLHKPLTDKLRKIIEEEMKKVGITYGKDKD